MTKEKKTEGYRLRLDSLSNPDMNPFQTGEMSICPKVTKDDMNKLSTLAEEQKR